MFLFCLASFPQQSYFEIIHSDTCMNRSSLFLTYSCSIVWMYHCFFIYSHVIHIWMVSCPWLLQIKLLWTLVYKYLVIFSNKWLGTEWLDHVICFIITDIARLFCKVVVSFYIFAISVCVLYSSTSLPTFGVVSLLYFCPFCTVCSDILLWF